MLFKNVTGSRTGSLSTEVATKQESSPPNKSPRRAVRKSLDRQNVSSERTKKLAASTFTVDTGKAQEPSADDTQTSASKRLLARNVKSSETLASVSALAPNEKTPPASCSSSSTDSVLRATSIKKKRRRKQPERKQEGSHSEEAQNDPKSGDVVDPSERILKRKRIGSYDCRKTPTDGIFQPTSTPKADEGLVAGDDKEEEEREALKEVKDAGGDRVAGVADRDARGEQQFSYLGLSAFTLSPKWCRNCDCRHEAGPESCPLRKPQFNFTDSVIDFSQKSGGNKSRDAACMHSIETTVPMASTKPSTPATSNLVSPDGLDLSKSFAQLSLPTPLQLVEREPGKGLSVVAKTDIAPRTQFGPLQGEKILERDVAEDLDMRELWQVFTEDGRRLYLSTANPEKSNWLRYLRPAPHRRARNVAAVVKNTDRLHFVTVRQVAEGEELVYWMDDPDLMWTKKRAEKKNCGGCNLRFSHPLYYRLHCTIFHDPQFSLTIRKYHCKVCGLAVLGKDNIVKHAMAEHDGRGAYQCQFCKKYFLRLNYLDMHRTYGCSSNPGRTRPLCNLCGKKFCQPQKLKIHMKRMHGDSSLLDELRCPICSKILGSRNALQRHKREVHAEDVAASPVVVVATPTAEGSSNSRASSSSGSWQGNSSLSFQLQQQQSQPDAASARVACEKCGRTFKNKSNLKIHMLTHSGVKPFWCKMDGCRSGFTTKQCLQFHYRKAHALTDEEMPKIEREIPYTLSAYSGGLCKDGEEREGEEGDDLDAVARGRKFKSNKHEGISAQPEKSASISNQRQEGGDVYSFEDDDEPRQLEQQRQQRRPRLIEHQESHKTSQQQHDENEEDSDRRSGIDGQIARSGKAGLLVMAALNAAEQDMKTKEKEEDSKEREDAASTSQALGKAQDRHIEESERQHTNDREEAEDDKATASSSAVLSHSAQSLIANKGVETADGGQIAQASFSSSLVNPSPQPPVESSSSPAQERTFLPPISSITSKSTQHGASTSAIGTATGSYGSFGGDTALASSYEGLYHPGLDLPSTSRAAAAAAAVASASAPSYQPHRDAYPYLGRHPHHDLYPSQHDPSSASSGLDDFARPPAPAPPPPHPFDALPPPPPPQHFPHLHALHPLPSDRDYSGPYHHHHQVPSTQPQSYPSAPPRLPPPSNPYPGSSASASAPPLSSGRLPPLNPTSPYHPYGYF